MGAQLFGRRARVIIGDDSALLIEDLRIQFKVKKTLKKEPNECQLTIYNLSPSSRAGLQTKGIKLILEAGYTNTVAQIFSGNVRFVDHEHSGPDWLTKVECADGEHAYRYNMVNESFKAGTAVADVFQRIAGRSGFDANAAVSFFRDNCNEQFTQGYAAIGPASMELDRLLSARGFEWSVQDNKLQVLLNGKTIKEPAVLLKSDSGLIGSPEHGTSAEERKQNILKVRSLLQPSIKPGGTVHVEAEGGLTGDFRTETVLHQGDTFGGDWYSDGECTPVS